MKGNDMNIESIQSVYFVGVAKEVLKLIQQ